jgi:protein O-GlcNAc transferase
MDYQRIIYDKCPLCKCSAIKELNAYDCRSHALWREGLPFVIRWSRCESCHHVFTNGYFSEEAMAFMMEKTQTGQDVKADENERLIMSLIVEKLMIDRKCLPVGQWLDVGFGSGALMMTAREFGFDVTGLDLRLKNFEDMKSRWYNAYNMTIERYAEIAAWRKFDVISMLDVLEHMPFPHTALEAASKLLNEGGKIIISCPNIDTEVWRELDRTMTNPYWVELEHYHNFDSKTLESLLMAHNFEPVSYGVSKRYRSGMEIISVKIGADLVVSDHSHE